MKVILRSDVEHLGRAGEVKEVAGGYARNFLLPRGLVTPATAAALAWWEKGKEKRQKLADGRRQKASELAAKLGEVSLSFARQVGAEGKLFGSVGRADILKSLKTSGHSIAPEALRLPAAIKTVGEHSVDVRLHHDVTAKIKVTVTARE